MNVTQEELDRIAAKAAEIQSVGGSLLSNASYLKKWVEALRPAGDDEPGPDPAPSLTVGATAHRLNESVADSFAWANTQIGPIGATRIFHRDLPPTHNPITPEGVQEIVSWKSSTVENVASFVESMRPGTMLVFHHEPEGPQDYQDGAAFVAAWEAEYEKVAAAGAELGMIAGGYQYRPGGRGADGSFLPPSDKCAWYGLDSYQEGAPPGGFRPIHAFEEGPDGDDEFWGWYNLVKDKDQPLLVTEYGRGTRGYDPDATTQRVQILPKDHAWLLDHGFTHWLYWYEDGQNGNMPEGITRGGWTFHDDQSKALWSSYAVDHTMST